MRSFLSLGISLAIALASPALATKSTQPKHASHYNGGLHLNAGAHTQRSNARRDGTYLQSYRATNPNRARSDLITKRSNVDPYKAEEGLKRQQGEEPHRF